MSLWTLVPPSDEVLIQRLFSNGEKGGYWPALRQYAYEDSAGTTAASVNGVVGLRLNAIAGYPNAVQATTANKPYLRLTPTTNKPWYDSNTATGAMNVTFASAMGRRNLITYTEAIGSTSWANVSSRAIVQLNNGLSPLNTLTATKLIRSTTVEHQRLFSVSTVVPISATYTVSVYAKAAENYQFALNCSTGFELGQFGSAFNLSAMTATGSGVITHVGDNWYRCSVSGLTTATEANLVIYLLTNTGSWTDAGNNVDGMYFWGAQLEPGTITDYQKIVAGPSAVLDPAALAATYPHNISASTNCTIACVTPEGVVIADNQTVGTTFNIAPPYGYNSDVLIINRALTPAEKALVTRVMQRSVPTLGSELVTNGGFDTDMTGWAGWDLVNSPNNIIQSNGKGVFLIDGIGGAVSASLDIAVSANNAYFLTCYCHNSELAVSDGKNFTYRFGAFEHDLNLQFKSIVPTQDYIRLYAYVPNNTAIQDVLYDNISLKAIL